MRLLTLIADLPLAGQARTPVPGYSLRPCMQADAEDLAHLHFEAYDPGIAYDTVDEAIKDYAATFTGAYGPLWLDASLVALAPDGTLAAAILTVRQAPWDQTPAGPFVIELFTHRSHRRAGLARSLLYRAADVISVEGHNTIALRVDESNRPARNLYESAGFEEW